MRQYFIYILFLITGFSINAQTEKITFSVPGNYPEGTAYSIRTKLFYVSSVITGTISSVDEKGNTKTFYEDKTLKSTFGMKVDDKQSHLWVCAGDPNYSKYSDAKTFHKMARLVSIDLVTAQKVSDIDLEKIYPGKHFLNDIAFDNSGNVYVTDSYAGIVYKVDKDGKASVFADSPLFKGEDVGLNGIVFHPQYYFLVANDRDGDIFKIDLKDPKKITRVKVNSFFPGADGLNLDKDNNLILIQNKGVNKIFQLTSTDNWQTATIKASTNHADRFQHPTTSAMKDGNIYILNSKMNELQDSTMGTSKEFSLQIAKFESK